MEETSVVPRGAEAASKITFYKLTEEWLKIKKGQVKQSTYSNYVNLIQKQLLPELGNLYVSSLTTPYLEQFLQKKLAFGRLDGKGGLSNKTVCDLPWFSESDCLYHHFWFAHQWLSQKADNHLSDHTHPYI